MAGRPQLLAWWGRSGRSPPSTSTKSPGTSTPAARGWSAGRANAGTGPEPCHQEELTILRTVLRWAVRRKTATGGRLLTEMPILAWHIPREENPRRPQLADAGYQALSQCAWAIDPRLWLALVVCHETGHRLNSVRQLRWGDIDETARTITWRGAAQKNRQQHITPLTDTARRVRAVPGERSPHAAGRRGAGRPVFYGGRDGGPVARDQFYLWWARARGPAPSPSRRAWASRLPPQAGLNWPRRWPW